MKKTATHFTDGIANLKTVLGKQHIYLLKMLAILKQERQALDCENLDQFSEIVQRKHQQVKRLEEIQPLLNTVEKMVGGALSKSTFTAFIQRMPNSTEKSDLITLWVNFQETLEECDLQNKINNRILSASTISKKLALDILRGNTGQSMPSVYCKSGLQQNKTKGQSLAIA